MYSDTPSIRRVAGLMEVSLGTVKRVLEPDADPMGTEA